MKLRTRRPLAAILVPLLIVGAAFPAFGLLGGLSGVASELTQILNVAENAISAVETAVTAAETANAVLELENQLQQSVDEAMGRVGALVERFEDLSSDPLNLVENSQGLAWAGDFNGQPRQLLNAFAEMQDSAANSLTTHWRQALAQADTIGRGRFRNVFRNVPTASATWLAQRERADRDRIFDYVGLDYAERITELLGSASDSVERSRQQTNLSDTALAQEQHATQLTRAEIDMGVAQLFAHQTARDAMERQTLELERRQQLQEWVTAVTAQRPRARRARNAVRGRGQAFSQALLLN